MIIELTDEQQDEIVANSISNWMIDLLESHGNGYDDSERWDMIANLYCTLQYYITHEQMATFMEEFPELAEELDWSEDEQNDSNRR